MSSQQETHVRSIKRFALGIFIGAVCGAVVATIILGLTAVRQTVGIYAADFEIAFGRSIGENIFTVLKILGALAGAAVGGSLAVSIRWFAVLLTLMAGIVIGGTTMFFVEVKTVKWVSGLWEQDCAMEKTATWLRCLRAIDQGTTNQLYLVRFQNSGRMVLTNYVHQVENLETDEYGDRFNTNSPFYKMAQKYLATHTNSLPLGSDF